MSDSDNDKNGGLLLGSRKLISLAEMIDLFAAGLVHNWQWLKAEGRAFHQKLSTDATGKPTPMEIHNLNALLKHHNATIEINGKKESIRGWMFYCNLLEMEKSKAVIEHFLMILNVTNSTPNFSVIVSHLGQIVNSLWLELFARKFLFIQQNKVRFFEQEKLFGDKVYAAFPSASFEIREAGSCIAADLNTAGVFHLMRAVEIGLRSLAIHLKAVKKSEIEHLQWSTIIEQIESKIRPFKTMPKSKKKSAALEFYHGVMGEFYAFKDVWRNNVMHTKRNYNAHDALAVYSHVESFMQRLAENISEK
jgi:hypothetical protein